MSVRRVDGGLFSTRLVDELRPGDVLDVLPPLGRFTPDLTKRGQHHVFVAAGSGITPVMSIMSAVLESDVDAQATLLYGNRRTDTVMFGDELADLKDRYAARLQLVHVLSREPREVALFSGRLDAARLSALLDAVVPTSDVDHWWLCGPFGVLTDADAALAEHGVPRTRVHRELFYVDEPPPPVVHKDASAPEGPAATVTVPAWNKHSPLRRSALMWAKMHPISLTRLKAQQPVAPVIMLRTILRLLRI